MKLTTETYGAYVNTNNSWWKATLTNEKLNPPKKPENKGHANPAIQAIHDNPNLTREEKITFANQILDREKALSKCGLIIRASKDISNKLLCVDCDEILVS